MICLVGVAGDHRGWHALLPIKRNATVSSADYEYGNIVDLERYPLHDADGDACRTLVRRLRQQLADEQYCEMPGFLLEACRLEEIERVKPVIPQANHASSMRNIYLEREPDPALPTDHPRNRFNPASYHMMGAHLLPDDSALIRLYYWPVFRQFISRITEETLYPSADPYQPVNVLCHMAGDRSAWHFDSDNAFTMTLMLQAPEGGGVFEMLPNSRSPEDPNIAGLRHFLDGDRSGVKSLTREEGTLMIFRGRDSAHQVTPVTGERERLMCVMVYEHAPGVTGNPVVNATVYGVEV